MNEPQSLRELVDLAMAKHQTSVRQLGFKAQEHGFKMHGTTLGHIRNSTYKSVPTDETIRAIAWLAGVSDEAAFTAAGQPVPGPPFAEELPPGVDNLPAKARKAAIDMLRVLVDMNKEVVGNEQHPTHMNQAGESPANTLELDRSFTGRGGLRPHLELTASRMFAVVERLYGRQLPSLDVALASEEVEAVLESELAKVEHNSVRLQFRKRTLQLLQGLLGQASESPVVTEGKKAPYVDPHAHPDADAAGNIPLPANYYDLAADSSRNYGAEEDARAQARGEETQDTEQGD